MKPILFNSEMVCAILDGRKTQTRRIAKLPEQWHRGYGSFDKAHPNGREEFVIHGNCGTETMYCPYGRVGDKLWVRESYHLHSVGEYHCEVIYAAGPESKHEYIDLDTIGIEKMLKILRKDNDRDFVGYHPSIHMPYEVARIFLEITGIRIERVQDITWQDCKAEGITLIGDELVFNNQKQKQTLMRTKFEHLWNSIHGKPKAVKSKGVITHYISYPWDDSGEYANKKQWYGKPHYCYPNPFCWVVEFKRVTNA